MAFWAVNSPLPHDHVRDHAQKENVEHINHLIAGKSAHSQIYIFGDANTTTFFVPGAYLKAKRERAARSAIPRQQVPQPMAAERNSDIDTDRHKLDSAEADLAVAIQGQTAVVRKQAELLGSIIREQTESLGERLAAVIKQRTGLVEESLVTMHQEQIAAIQQQTMVLEDRLSHQTRVIEKTLVAQTQAIEKMATSVEKMTTSVEQMSTKMVCLPPITLPDA